MRTSVFWASVFNDAYRHTFSRVSLCMIWLKNFNEILSCFCMACADFMHMKVPSGNDQKIVRVIFRNFTNFLLYNKYLSFSRRNATQRVVTLDINMYTKTILSKAALILFYDNMLNIRLILKNQLMKTSTALKRNSISFLKQCLS